VFLRTIHEIDHDYGNCHPLHERAGSLNGWPALRPTVPRQGRGFRAFPAFPDPFEARDKPSTKHQGVAICKWLHGLWAASSRSGPAMEGRILFNFVMIGKH